MVVPLCTRARLLSIRQDNTRVLYSFLVFLRGGPSQVMGYRILLPFVCFLRGCVLKLESSHRQRRAGRPWMVSVGASEQENAKPRANILIHQRVRTGRDAMRSLTMLVLEEEFVAQGDPKRIR